MSVPTVSARAVVDDLGVRALNEARMTWTRRLRRRERGLRKARAGGQVTAWDLTRLAATIQVLQERGHRIAPLGDSPQPQRG